ncbi:MAG: methionine--tRNA ligase [Actinomycetota bacterium]
MPTEKNEQSETFYLTTPIYYVNARPHLGHAYTSIAADTLARWKRMRGFDVRFLTGTDEHGQKIERSAVRTGKTPGQFAAEISGEFRALWDRMGLTYDDFIRTTEERHTGPVQRLAQQLYDQADVYLGEYEGPYCVACETFYQPSEIIDGCCPIHERPVEMLKEKNYFFRLSAYRDQLLELYRTQPDFVQPESRRNEVVSLVRGGLQDLSMSRTSFSWGVPIPWDPAHVMYVWVDALQNYITAVGYGSDPERFARIWPADYHFIGKDILRHHAVIWPALLMAAGLSLPRHVFAHGFLTVGGKKMSKTNLTGISPHTLLDTFGSDGYRYHFLREGSFGADGAFSWEAMVTRYNAELANDLGNLVSRALAMVTNYFEALVPPPGPATPAEEGLAAAAANAASGLIRGAETLDLPGAMESAMSLVRATNLYINEAAPWKLAKDPEQRERLATVLYAVCEAIRVASVLFSPAMPAASRRIRAQLGVPEVEERPLAQAIAWGDLAPGTRVQRGDPIFPRIDAAAEESA